MLKLPSLLKCLQINIKCLQINIKCLQINMIIKVIVPYQQYYK